MKDTWDPEVLGGGFSHYAGVNHGTFLHIAHEEVSLVSVNIYLILMLSKSRA
jgi:agmatinase